MSRRALQGRSGVRWYLEEIRRYPMLSRDGERELFARGRGRDREILRILPEVTVRMTIASGWTAPPLPWRGRPPVTGLARDPHPTSLQRVYPPNSQEGGSR